MSDCADYDDSDAIPEPVLDADPKPVPAQAL